MKLDLGCGKNCKEGFEGVDIKDYGQPYKKDLRYQMADFTNESVAEVYTRNFIPCLTDLGQKYERVKFFNELHRILKPDGFATLIIPSWSASGGHINPQYQEPFFEGSLYMLNKAWREANAPEICDLYTCNFDPTWGYNMHPGLTVRNQEYQQFALANYINAAMELIITLKKAKT